MIDAHAHTTHVTPYDRLAWTDDTVEALLARGERRDELVAYFGERDYLELAALARKSHERRPRGPHVVILPGIMGSQLSLPRAGGQPADVLWLDPLDISAGRLRELALPGAAELRASSVLLYSYLKLKLELKLADYRAVLFEYDWRRSVSQLGREVAARIAKLGTAEVAIVAHSLGGLVARAAMTALQGAEVSRLIMLGTPNLGSFGAVQAMRGTYAVVRKVATIDRGHSAEFLARHVFMTFTSLLEMLPHACATRIDLGDLRGWPSRGLRPRARALQDARRVQRALIGGDERMTVIAGTGCDTVTELARADDQFIYTVSPDGDGTVPLRLASLPGTRTYYARAAHSELPRDDAVIRAIVDLLTTGETMRLPGRAPARSRLAGKVSDRQLRRLYRYKVDWLGLTADQRRHFLENLNDPPRVRLRPRAASNARRDGR